MRARGIINDNDDDDDDDDDDDGDDDDDDDDDDVCVCGVRACACASVQNLVQYILLEQSCATLPISSKNTRPHIVLRLAHPHEGSAFKTVCHLRTNPAAIPGLIKMGTAPSGPTEGTLMAQESWQNVRHAAKKGSHFLWVILRGNRWCFHFVCVSIYANHPSGDTLTYVPDSIPMGNDADETQLYEVPDSQLVNTPVMKEALSKEAAGCAEALLGKNSRIYPSVSYINIINI